MAAPTPQEVAIDAKCFLCLSEKQLMAMVAYQLGQILLQSDSMADVTPEAIARASSCFTCLSGKQLIAAQVYLLTQIFNNGSGGGGTGVGAVLRGNGAPVGASPGSAGKLYYDLDTNVLYQQAADNSWPSP